MGKVRNYLITRLGGTPGQSKSTEAEKNQYATSQIQARDGLSTPFDSYFDKYRPSKNNMQLFDIIREAIPLMDVALRKRARLISGVRLDGLGNAAVQKVLDSIYSVNVGWMQSGINTLVEQVADSAMHKGYSVWEMVPDMSDKSIQRTVVGKPDNFRVRLGEAGVPIIEQEIGPGAYEPMPRQDLLFYQVFGRTDGGFYGKPVFWACPFMTKIIVRIMAAVDNVVWRFGDPTIVSILKGGEASDIKDVSAAAANFGAELTRAMGARKVGQVYDVQVGVPEKGDFEIKLLGADSKPMDVAVDYKLILEQIISASELPPWMFGLSWATTERLSTNQNEATISLIEGQRRAMEPGIERLVTTALIMAGKGGAQWKLDWEPLNLSDETAIAQARFYNAQSIEKELMAAMSLYTTGLLDEEQLVNYVVQSGLIQESELYGSNESKLVKIEQIRKEAQRRNALESAKTVMQNA